MLQAWHLARPRAPNAPSQLPDVPYYRMEVEMQDESGMPIGGCEPTDSSNGVAVKSALPTDLTVRTGEPRQRAP